MLRDRIADEMRRAMKARDGTRVSTLRMLMAAVKNREVDEGHELDDDETIDVVAREAKRRRESIDAYEGAGRTDLVDKERAELTVLEEYLPAGLSEEELAAIVTESIAEAGATSPREMGAVMKLLMPKVKGRADGNVVSQMVRSRLGG